MDHRAALPGERLIACRNPALAAERARKREDLLAATEKLLAPIAARGGAGRLSGAAAIGAKAGEVLGKYKMRKHFTVAITDRSLTVARDQAGTVTAYKNLKYVELRFAGTPAVVPVLTEPTSRQKQAFDLIGAPVPAVLRK